MVISVIGIRFCCQLYLRRGRASISFPPLRRAANGRYKPRASISGDDWALFLTFKLLANANLNLILNLILQTRKCAVHWSIETKNKISISVSFHFVTKEAPCLLLISCTNLSRFSISRTLKIQQTIASEQRDTLPLRSNLSSYSLQATITEKKIKRVINSMQ